MTRPEPILRTLPSRLSLRSGLPLVIGGNPCLFVGCHLDTVCAYDLVLERIVAEEEHEKIQIDYREPAVRDAAMRGMVWAFTRRTELLEAATSGVWLVGDWSARGPIWTLEVPRPGRCGDIEEVARFPECEEPLKRALFEARKGALSEDLPFHDPDRDLLTFAAAASHVLSGTFVAPDPA